MPNAALLRRVLTLVEDKRVALALAKTLTGRKNWMFAGSDEGGRRAAILFSLVVTCKRHDVDPYAYFRDVIKRMPTFPKERVAELLPHRWKAAKAADAAS